jgi:hypothetical protein
MAHCGCTTPVAAPAPERTGPARHPAEQYPAGRGTGPLGQQARPMLMLARNVHTSNSFDSSQAMLRLVHVF